MEKEEGHFLPRIDCTPPNAPSLCCLNGTLLTHVQLLFTFPKLFSIKPAHSNWCIGLLLPKSLHFPLFYMRFAFIEWDFCQPIEVLDSSTKPLGLSATPPTLASWVLGSIPSMILCVKKMLNKTETSTALCNRILVIWSPTMLCADDQHCLQLASQCSMHLTACSSSSSFTCFCIRILC